MSEGFLDFIDGEDVTPSKQAASTTIEHMYRPGEAFFGTMASTLVSKGWSVFPQDQQRRPGRVNGEPIKWIKSHKLPEKLPHELAVKSWVKNCPTHNVALALGRGSGGIFALDIDVTDELKSNRITALADEFLGTTPFARVGSFPKIALFYRFDPEDPVSNISRHFAETDEEGHIIASPHALEVLTEGKPITLYGLHHKTGRYFKWLRTSPLEQGPEAAPLVSSDRLADFLEAVDENVQRFHRNPGTAAAPVEIEWDENAKVNVPRLQSVAGGAAWVENDDGLIVDGREAYLTRLVFSFAQNNPNMPTRTMIGHVVDQFKHTAKVDGRWSGNNLVNEVRTRIERLREKVQSGDISLKPSRRRDGAGVDTDSKGMPFSKTELEERDLGFLPDSFARKSIKAEIVEKSDPVTLSEEERSEQLDNIQLRLREALDAFFEDVFMADCGNVPSENRVHVIKAPTGGGKTSRTLQYIGEMKDVHEARANAPRLNGRRNEDGTIATPAEGLTLEYQSIDGSTKTGKKPIVFLLPTYANIEEVRARADILNLDGSASDEELKAAAVEKGIMSHDEAEARLEDMKRDAMNAGLETMVYKGKIAAGCQFEEKVQRAMNAGIGTSGFCKSQNPDPEDNTPILCEFYHSCPAITQRDRIQQSDLVFMPHPFMHLQLPDDLLHARAIIADERVHHLFLHTEEFSRSTLELERPYPRLTKREREMELHPREINYERQQAADIVLQAFAEGGCPADKIYKFSGKDEDGELTFSDNQASVTDENGLPTRPGLNLVRSCIRVCTGGLRKDVNLTPNTSIEEVEEMCDRPTGLNLREELQFWEIIQDRVQQLISAETVRAAQANISASKDVDERMELMRKFETLSQHPMPKGDRELRIQWRHEHNGPGDVSEKIRISWRTTPNWADIPLLLLDASAAPEIINKIWNGTEVVTHDVGGPLNMQVVGIVDRTYSNASVIGDPSASESEKVTTAQRLSKIRTAISSVSAWYGHSRVVAGSSILIRKTLNSDWMCPENVDWCHFGAMRGLDFAKHHGAAISIGRMELPVPVIDGLVAALTYDDETPELPFDKYGSGLTRDLRPLMMPNGNQSLKMRTGEVVNLPAPKHPGFWGRLIQNQYREEELLQFCGRLRPVYREGKPPVWFAMSSVIPESLVIDDLITLDDLVTPSSYIWDAIRRTHGVVHPDVLAHECPELFENAADAADAMVRFGGFNHKHGTRTGQKTIGFTPYRIRSERADAFAFVRTEVSDKPGLLTAQLGMVGIAFDELEEISAGQAPAVKATSRTPDKIEVELGSLDMRSDRERRTGIEATMRIMERGEQKIQYTVGRTAEKEPIKKSFPLRYAAGRSEGVKDLYVTYADAEAQETLRRVWEQQLYEAERKQISTQMNNGAAAYDSLGNHTEDA